MSQADVQREDAKLLAKARAIGPLRTGYPMKVCRYCVQPIPLDALVCKFCTRDVNTEAEVEALCRDYLREVIGARDRRRNITIAIVAVVIVLWLFGHWTG